ncbi:coiled-coil domain-containing protein 169-like isoform X2 [Halichondria panicea]|uniref:coiled-coil domain-containing protein 169-like isoform X2 n=1 Tax=Halichondria panicea TaxID=6063 RepID=UPI00312B4E97
MPYNSSDYLLTTTERMKKAVYESQLILKDIPKEDNVWKDRVEEQQTYNRELESELALLEKKYKELRTQFEANSQSSEPAYDDMSDSKMRLLLKQLEKEKESVERQLKDCEWRLDQEAASRYKAEDEKKKILTQLEHIRSQEAVGKPPS